MTDQREPERWTIGPAKQGIEGTVELAVKNGPWIEANVEVVAAADYDRVVEELRIEWIESQRRADARVEALERQRDELGDRVEDAEREVERWKQRALEADAQGALERAESRRLREALREIARNWPDTDMTRERVDDLLVQSASTAERALAEPEEGRE